MASCIGVVIFVLSLLSCSGPFCSLGNDNYRYAGGYSTTTEFYWRTYAFFGYSSDCSKTVYLTSGSTFRINAWSSSKSDYGSSCTLYFETYVVPSNPRFTYKFDSAKDNYINDDSVSLKIYDTQYASSYPKRYTDGSSLPTYGQTVYSEYFTVKLERDFGVDDFDFSLIVSVDYDTSGYAYTTSVHWYYIVWPIVAVIVFISVVAGAIRSCRYRQLARSRASNVATAAVVSTSGYTTGTQPYPTAPPSYPAQSYPMGNQAYPAQPQASPAQPQAYPTQPQAYPTQPQAYPPQPQAYPTQPQPYPAQPYPGMGQAPPAGEADNLPPKYEDVASSYPAAT